MTDDDPIDLSAILRWLDPDAFKAKPDQLYRGTLDRLKLVLAGEPGEPWPAWSTGEWLAVALALHDTDRLTAEGWSVEDIHQTLPTGWNLLARALSAPHGAPAAGLSGARR